MLENAMCIIGTLGIICASTDIARVVAYGIFWSEDYVKEMNPQSSKYIVLAIKHLMKWGKTMDKGFQKLYVIIHLENDNFPCHNMKLSSKLVLVVLVWPHQKSPSHQRMLMVLQKISTSQHVTNLLQVYHQLSH